MAARLLWTVKTGQYRQIVLVCQVIAWHIGNCNLRGTWKAKNKGPDSENESQVNRDEVMQSNGCGASGKWKEAQLSLASCLVHSFPNLSKVRCSLFTFSIILSLGDASSTQ